MLIVKCIFNTKVRNDSLKENNVNARPSMLAAGYSCTYGQRSDKYLPSEIEFKCIEVLLGAFIEASVLFPSRNVLG